jgi:hypothetical protein
LKTEIAALKHTISLLNEELSFEKETVKWYKDVGKLEEDFRNGLKAGIARLEQKMHLI